MRKSFTDEYDLAMSREYTKNIDTADQDFIKWKISANKELTTWSKSLR